MAALAFSAFVFIAQGELGVLVMVERIAGPSALVMALLAFIPQAALVHVIRAMAGNTSGEHFLLVQRCLVTAIALGGAVFSVQRKFGVFVVIKMNGFPILFRMTSLAFLAKAPFMLIILTMANDTSFGGFFVFSVFMAILAFGLFMLT